MSILRKLKNKIVDDLIPNELKSPAGAIATALAVDQFGIPLPGGSEIGSAISLSSPQDMYKEGSNKYSIVCLSICYLSYYSLL